MPRGVKRTRNISEEIQDLENKILAHETKIKSLKHQVDTLKKEMEQEKLQMLNKLLSESGLSADEVIKSLKKAEEGKAS